MDHSNTSYGSPRVSLLTLAYNIQIWVCHLRGNIGPLDHRTVFGYRVGSAAAEVSDIAESQVNFESDG